MAGASAIDLDLEVLHTVAWGLAHLGHSEPRNPTGAEMQVTYTADLEQKPRKQKARMGFQHTTQTHTHDSLAAYLSFLSVGDREKISSSHPDSHFPVGREMPS
jgi:hypothetical protein